MIKAKYSNSLLITSAFLLGNLFFIACDNSTDEGKTNEDSSSVATTGQEQLLGKIKYQFEEFSEDECGEACSYVSINYPKTDLDKLQNGIDNLVENELSNFIRDSKDLAEPAAYVDAFFELFKEFKQTFPETRTPWSLEINMEITYQGSEWICIRKNVNAYTGGAHPNEITEFHLLDKKGYRFPAEKLITNNKKLKKIAELEFRNKNNIPAEEPLKNTKYAFEDGKFTLPDNIGFSDRGMILYYNNYDLTSYAEGAIEFTIPYAKIKDCIFFNAVL